jgi:hypothetical protein
MKTLGIIVTASLVIAYVCALPVALAAKPEPATAAKPSSTPSPAAPQQPITEELRTSLEERQRAIQAERLQRIRQILEAKDDVQWSKIEPLIIRLEQLRRADDTLRRFGAILLASAQVHAHEAVLSDKDRILEHLEAVCPDLSAEELERLAATRANLALIFRKPDASDKEMKAALEAWGAAGAELKRSIAAANEALMAATTPKQQAGLTLLGVLD